jgi:hypothetical protein
LPTAATELENWERNGLLNIKCNLDFQYKKVLTVHQDFKSFPWTKANPNNQMNYKKKETQILNTLDNNNGICF